MKRSATFNLRPTLASALLVLMLCMLAGCSGHSGDGGPTDKARVAALQQQITALASRKAALQRQVARLQHQTTVAQRSWYRRLLTWGLLGAIGFGGGQTNRAQLVALTQQAARLQQLVTALLAQNAALQRQAAHLQHQRAALQRSWYRWLVIWVVAVVAAVGGGILLGVRAHRQWHQQRGPHAAADLRTQQPAINGAAAILHR